MRIACPNCAAEYEVPDAALATGPRLLRCAKCSHQFTASLPAAEAEPPPKAKPLSQPVSQPVAEPVAKPAAAAPQASAESVPARAAPEPAPAPAPITPSGEPGGAAPTSAGTDRVALFGWVATLFVLLGAAAAVFTQHAAIAAAWPPAQRLFSALGLG